MYIIQRLLKQQFQLASLYHVIDESNNTCEYGSAFIQNFKKLSGLPMNSGRTHQ